MDKRGLSTAFQLLDSPDIQAVNQFVENLKHYEKDSWVVENLITYYLNTQSQKAAHLIAQARNEHEKVIFRRLHNGFSDRNGRKYTLKLLSYIVSKRPPWLYKILDEPILKDVFSCMKHELNVPMLLDAVYITTMLLPVVPDGMVKYFEEMFDNLIRLMQLSFYNKEGLPHEYILHLNVGVYSYFARLYGMYPWHFIVTLREYYAKQRFHSDFYKKAIEPTLSTVKLNPSLITASRESETRGDQWRSKAIHDIVAECSSLLLDVTEGTKDYDCRCPVLANRCVNNVEESEIKQEETIATVSTDDGTAPIELAKGSLISEAMNSAFFSPSDRLGLSTPPFGEPVTPGTTVGCQFSFSTSSQGTPQQNAGQIKTPHSSSHNTPLHLYTPVQYTPKNTPTIDSGGASSRSRHTSGTKVACLSRVSVDESIPPSPLRKEFTAEPPIDVPKISASAESSTVNTGISVTNLPHILEKISDTASSKTHDTDTSNNSEDEEVESITQLTADSQTVQSVAEFMKTVNRIRFISMTTGDSESEKLGRGSLKRSDSCPIFSEDMYEETLEDEINTGIERSVSNQTTSSNERSRSKDSTGSVIELSGSSHDKPTDEMLDAELPDLRLAYNYPTSGKVANTLPADSGAGSILDSHIILLNERLKLGSAVHRQLQDRPRQHEVNWTHFGVSFPTDEASIVRGELVLLHTQLLYERQKRELHAERNRRMLSKIAKAQKMKESNKSLEEQLARSRDDIFNLQTTIRLQNNEIHRMKEERSRSDTSREGELTSLIKENERLKYANEEFKREFKSKAEEFDVKSQELQASIGKYEILEREYTEMSVMNSQYRIYENEVCRMKKELLLMGEVQLKYQEKLSAIKYDNQMAVACSDQEAKYIADITKLNESLQKLAEAGQLKQSQIELFSSKIKEKDTVIQEQNKRLLSIQGEHACRLKAAEEKFNMAQAARQALEIQIMSLYDQIGRLSVPTTPKQRTNSTATSAVQSPPTATA